MNIICTSVRRRGPRGGEMRQVSGRESALSTIVAYEQSYNAESTPSCSTGYINECNIRYTSVHTKNTICLCVFAEYFYNVHLIRLIRYHV